MEKVGIRLEPKSTLEATVTLCTWLVSWWVEVVCACAAQNCSTDSGCTELTEQLHIREMNRSSFA